jgi:hypothetical protein
VSAIITASGELEEVAGVHERAALVGTVRPESRATTLMLAWGDWFGPAAAALGAVLLVAGLAGRRGAAALVVALALLAVAGCGGDGAAGAPRTWTPPRAVEASRPWTTPSAAWAS